MKVLIVLGAIATATNGQKITASSPAVRLVMAGER